jgi:hypothetical protein
MIVPQKRFGNNFKRGTDAERQEDAVGYVAGYFPGKGLFGLALV